MPRLLATALVLGLVGCGQHAPSPPLADRGVEGPADQRQGERRLADQRSDQAPVQSRWVTIPPGVFVMGSRLDEPCRQVGETEHQVTLTRRFEILSTEVTQAAFAQAMGYVPFSSCGSDCPVADVSWNEAAAYANALSKQKGLALCYACSGSGSELRCEVSPSLLAPAGSLYECQGYRLPTEAEWELAYRGGTTTAFYDGAKAASCSGADAVADRIGWYKANSASQMQRAGQKQPNPLGLYDLAGNVAEWVNDRYQEDLGTLPVTDPVGPSSGNQRVLRGGSFDSEALELRAAARAADLMVNPWSDYGFRVARTLPP